MAHGWIRMFQGKKMMYEGLFRMGKPVDGVAKMKNHEDQEEVPQDLQFRRLTPRDT